MFADVPARPWDEASLTPLDLRSDGAADAVRRTADRRGRALAASDRRPPPQFPPRYLPPQFPQSDRSVHRSLASPAAAVVGLPPRCCPTNSHHRFVTRNKSAVLSEAELADCACRAPRNYPEGFGRPVATLVTAFYQSESKARAHPTSLQ